MIFTAVPPTVPPDAGEIEETTGARISSALSKRRSPRTARVCSCSAPSLASNGNSSVSAFSCSTQPTVPDPPGPRSTPIRSSEPIGRLVGLGWPARLVAAALVPTPSQPPSSPDSSNCSLTVPEPTTRQLLISPAPGAKMTSSFSGEKLGARVSPPPHGPHPVSLTAFDGTSGTPTVTVVAWAGPGSSIAVASTAGTHSTLSIHPLTGKKYQFGRYPVNGPGGPSRVGHLCTGWPPVHRDPSHADRVLRPAGRAACAAGEASVRRASPRAGAWAEDHSLSTASVRCGSQDPCRADRRRTTVRTGRVPVCTKRWEMLMRQGSVQALRASVAEAVYGGCCT